MSWAWGWGYRSFRRPVWKQGGVSSWSPMYVVGKEMLHRIPREQGNKNRMAKWSYWKTQDVLRDTDVESKTPNLEEEARHDLY